MIPETKKSLNWIDDLNDNKIRVLYVLGNQDHLFSKDTIKYSKMIDNSKVEVINNSGHVCSIEKYDEFNQIILSYLNSTTV